MSGAPDFRGPIAMLAVAALGAALLVVTAQIRFANDAELARVTAINAAQREIIEAFRQQRDYAMAAASIPIVQIPLYIPCPAPRLLPRIDPPRVTPVFR